MSWLAADKIKTYQYPLDDDVAEGPTNTVPEESGSSGSNWNPEDEDEVTVPEDEDMDLEEELPDTVIKKKVDKAPKKGIDVRNQVNALSRGQGSEEEDPDGEIQKRKSGPTPGAEAET